MKKLFATIITLILVFSGTAAFAQQNNVPLQGNGGSVVPTPGGPVGDAIDAGAAVSSEVNEARRVGGFVPCDGSAADPCEYDDFFELMQRIINFATGLAFLVAIGAFAYTGVTYLIIGKDNASKRTQAKKRFKYSLIGLFFVAGAWTIVSFITNTFVTEEFKSETQRGEDIDFLEGGI